MATTPFVPNAGIQATAQSIADDISHVAIGVGAFNTLSNASTQLANESSRRAPSSKDVSAAGVITLSVFFPASALPNGGTMTEVSIVKLSLIHI